MNLSQAVDRQRERLELMRTFTHWRLQHSEARVEVRGLGTEGRVWWVFRLPWGPEPCLLNCDGAVHHAFKS